MRNKFVHSNYVNDSKSFLITVPAACGDNGEPKEFTKVNFENAKGGNTKHIKK